MLGMTDNPSNWPTAGAVTQVSVAFKYCTQCSMSAQTTCRFTVAVKSSTNTFKTSKYFRA